MLLDIFYLKIIANTGTENAAKTSSPPMMKMSFFISKPVINTHTHKRPRPHHPVNSYRYSYAALQAELHLVRFDVFPRRYCQYGVGRVSGHVFKLICRVSVLRCYGVVLACNKLRTPQGKRRQIAEETVNPDNRQRIGYTP
jgi:hypothetical protein